MADYNEDGSPVETPETASPQVVETGVAEEVVTIIAPSVPSLLGLLVMIGALWYLSSGRGSHEDQ